MRWASLQSRLLQISILVTAIAITIIPVISKVQVATSLGVAFALGGVAIVSAFRRLDWRMAAPWLLIIGGLVVWTALGLNWAVDPGFSAEKLGRVLPILLLGPLMVIILRYAGETDGAWLAKALSICIFGGIGWILAGRMIAELGLSADWLSAMFPSGDSANAGLTTLAIVIWLLPMATDPKHRPRWLAAVYVGVALLLFTGKSDAAILGFLAGGAVYLLDAWRRRLGTVAMVVIVSASALAPVFVAPVAYERAWNSIDWMPSSWLHRLEIWDAAVDHAATQPIGGSGIDSFRLLEHDQPSRLDEMKPQGQAMHPHHSLLQVWVEIGLVGVALLTALSVWAVRHVLTWPAGERAAAQAGIAATAVILGLSYGFWQGWWLALLFAVSGYAVGLVARRRQID